MHFFILRLSFHQEIKAMQPGKFIDPNSPYRHLRSIGPEDPGNDPWPIPGDRKYLFKGAAELMGYSIDQIEGGNTVSTTLLKTWKMYAKIEAETQFEKGIEKGKI